MVFLPKTLWDDLPLELSELLHANYMKPVNHERDVIVVGKYAVHRLEGAGNWFQGNLPVIPEKSPPG